MTKQIPCLPLSLAQLAQFCQGQVIGDATIRVKGICSAEKPYAQGLAYIGNKRLIRQIDKENETVYIVKPEQADAVKNGILHDNPMQAFRLILTRIYPSGLDAEPCIQASAQISSSASIADNVSIGHHCVIEDNVRIAEGCRIGNGCIIATQSVLGKNTQLGNRVSILANSIIGTECVIADGAVIGGQGFGFSFEGGVWQAVPQIGKVVIGDKVHIGNNSCIDRGAINDTVIGNNVIIDNLVHIAHNVHIGNGSAMAASVGIAGSTSVGKNCMMGGQVGVAGHIHITDAVQINGGARVLQSIKQSGTYSGSFHVMPVWQWNRTAIYLKKLVTLLKREKNRE